MALVAEGIDPLSMPNLFFTETTKESMEINERQGSAIIIAGNGMCTGGRIRHHLKHNLWRRGASLVIVGFQALGTTGREIVDGAKFVRIFGEKVAVQARVFTIGGFSAHAGQKDILDWVGKFETKPVVYVVHGEPNSSEALKNKIEELFGLEVHIPKYRERLILKPRPMGPESEALAVQVKDMAALYYNLLLDIEKEVKRLRDILKQPVTASLEEDMDKLQYILEELRDVGKR